MHQDHLFQVNLLQSYAISRILSAILDFEVQEIHQY